MTDELDKIELFVDSACGFSIGDIVELTEEAKKREDVRDWFGGIPRQITAICWYPPCLTWQYYALVFDIEGPGYGCLKHFKHTESK
mgnify:CR=1 FL=1